MDGVIVKRVLAPGQSSAISTGKSAKGIKTADQKARHSKNRRAQ